MRMGLGLGISSHRATAPFSITNLFASGEEGAIYDPTDLSTMFQDTDGTTPVTTSGQTCRLIHDISGNGNHASSAVGCTFMESNGVRWLEGDGTDDLLIALFTVSLPWTRISGLRQISWTQFAAIFSGGAATRGRLLQMNSATKLALYDGSTHCLTGDIGIDIDFVASEVHNGAASSLTINTGAFSTPATGDPGSDLPDGISIFGRHDGTQFSNVRLYRCVMIDRLLTAAETAGARSWAAAPAGVPL